MKQRVRRVRLRARCRGCNRRRGTREEYVGLLGRSLRVKPWDDENQHPYASPQVC